MNSGDEIRHLQTGTAPGEKPQDLFPVNFTAHCPGDAEAVLGRAKEVLEVVLRQDPAHWPSDRDWEDLLPQWFVAKCAPVQSAQERERSNELWRQLSYEEKVRAERTERWSLTGWMYWFQPEMLEWYWWNASVPNRDTVIVVVQVEGFPFPHGALDWLLSASGAVTVDNDLP